MSYNIMYYLSLCYHFFAEERGILAKRLCSKIIYQIFFYRLWDISQMSNLEKLQKFISFKH